MREGRGGQRRERKGEGREGKGREGKRGKGKGRAEEKKGIVTI